MDKVENNKAIDVKYQAGADANIDGNSGISKIPLNQILFGPPGTGKTYHTINKALEILEPDFVCKEENREEALKRFNQYKKDGRIVFTTFHQSMSYEDFIEGIKPQTNNAGQVTYELEDGIFKIICRKSYPKNPVEAILEDFVLKQKEFVKKTGKFWLRGIIGNLVVTEDDRNNPTPILHLPLIKHIIQNGGEIKERYDDLEDGRNSINSTEKSYYNPVIEKINQSLSTYNANQQRLPTVLIIDEINRGNIANIFGELITLIEEDKRIGRPEALEVQLPYSKKPFGVPDNLYIIGTMNTADRSVEALDSALRRRFSFVEMMPKPSLLKVKIAGTTKTLEDLLNTINERIVVLKDREHQIGHSYFMKFAKMKEVNANDLKEVFTDKIIPLLQEYFYGDYEKIQLVLGNGFVKSESLKVVFAGGASYDDLPEKRYEIFKDPNMPEALATLLNIPTASDQSQNTEDEQ